MVICLERGADLHIAQLMPLPLTVSCFSKTQIGFTFLVLAHPGSPGKKSVKRVCVCVYIYTQTLTIVKAGGPLGLSIVGGQGHTSHPFGVDNPGVFISKVRVISIFYVVKWQLTICFKSPKPIQIGLCMLIYLSIHLPGLHLDAQCGQARHLSTQLCSGERTGRQPHCCYRPYYPTARFRLPRHTR